MNTEFPGTTYARATREYDEEFKRALISEIIAAIARVSICGDDTKPKIMAIRTGETVEALLSCLISFAAMSPYFDTPSHLREFAENAAKRIRRDIARARAEGTFDNLGAGKGGRA